MLYNIHISQIALSDLGIGNLDYNDLAIFNAVEYMHSSNSITKQVINSVQYSLINWKLIKKQLPFLQGSSGSTIKKRLKKLELAGLIEICPLNQQLYSPYYRMGKNYDSYKVKKEEPYVKNETPLSNSENPLLENEEAPLSNSESNNSISYNNINYNSKEEFFNYFYSQYPVKTHKKYALRTWLKLSVENMIKAVEGITTFTKGKELKYIKNPQAYLNGEHWNDEPLIDKEEETEHIPIYLRNKK